MKRTKEKQANNKPFSTSISDFLSYIRECEQDYKIAGVNEQETNDATQDILHCIELEDNDYHTYARFAKRLKEIRNARRVAKDTREQLEPVVEWAEQNQNSIKSLERLLGDVRKIEKKAECRFYIPRTEEVSNIKNKKAS